MENGTFIIIKIDEDKLIGELSNSYSGTGDEIDISSKVDGLEADALPGRVSESISFESLSDETNVNDYGWATAYAAQTTAKEIDFEIIKVDALGVQVNASEKHTGKGVIQNLTKSNPDNDRSTFSGTIEISDESTVATYTAPAPD
jgi:hypothetical protein